MEDKFVGSYTHNNFPGWAVELFSPSGCWFGTAKGQKNRLFVYYKGIQRFNFSATVAPMGNCGLVEISYIYAYQHPLSKVEAGCKLVEEVMDKLGLGYSVLLATDRVDGGGTCRAVVGWWPGWVEVWRGVNKRYALMDMPHDIAIWHRYLTEKYNRSDLIESKERVTQDKTNQRSALFL